MMEICPLEPDHNFCWHYAQGRCGINSDNKRSGFKKVGKSNEVSEIPMCPLENYKNIKKRLKGR